MAFTKIDSLIEESKELLQDIDDDRDVSLIYDHEKKFAKGIISQTHEFLEVCKAKKDMSGLVVGVAVLRNVIALRHKV